MNFMIIEQPLVVCICTTYGRHTMMNRLLSFWRAQTYPNKRLLILNTAPYELAVARELPEFEQIEVVNRSQCARTARPYQNVGEVRTDAVDLAEFYFGEHCIFCLFDDDDAYFPYHIGQGVRNLLQSGKRAWKPAQSLYSGNGGKTFEPCSNALEATVFVHLSDIKRLGFRAGTGDENLAWYDGLKKEGQLVEDPTGIASYVYEWGSPVAPHKQSGDIKNPNNFENHKRASTDFGDGKPLAGDYRVWNYYDRVIEQHPQLMPYFPKGGQS